MSSHFGALAYELSAANKGVSLLPASACRRPLAGLCLPPHPPSPLFPQSCRYATRVAFVGMPRALASFPLSPFLHDILITLALHLRQGASAAGAAQPLAQPLVSVSTDVGRYKAGMPTLAKPNASSALVGTCSRSSRSARCRGIPPNPLPLHHSAPDPCPLLAVPCALHFARLPVALLALVSWCASPHPACLLQYCYNY